MDAITLNDSIQAGQVSALHNAVGSAGWEAARLSLNQETDGDKRPTN